MTRKNTHLLTILLCVGPLYAQFVPISPAASSQTTSKLPAEEELAAQNPDLPCPKGRNQTAKATFGDYTIRTYRWPIPEGCLRISKKGKLVYSRTGWNFKIGGNFFRDPGIPIGTDITGNGIPTAIIGEWSGGAHCCFTLHVFELGDHFRQIAKINAGHSDGARFVDLDHDGAYEFDGNDWAFAYWGASFMQSPAPKVILKYRNGRFELATDLMAKPHLTQKEFAEIVHEVQADNQWDDALVPTVCWVVGLRSPFGENVGVPVHRTSRFGMAFV